MKYSIFPLLFFMFTIGQAQKINWGTLSQKEIDLEKVDFEPDADLVILEEVGDLSITQNGYEILEYSKIKILTHKGLELINRSWQYPFLDKYNKVIFEKGQTLNVENGVIKEYPIKKTDIIIHQFDEETEELKVIFPNVRIGSVIEYQIKRIDGSELYSSPWRFQNNHPTLKSTLHMRNNSKYSYKTIFLGERINAKYGNRPKQKFWELTDVPSVNTYTYVHNVNDHRDRVIIQFNSAQFTGRSYYSVNKWKDFKKVLLKDINSAKKNVKVADIAMKIPSGNTKEETLVNCLKYLQENYKWSQVYSVVPQDLKQNLLAKKKAHTADFNVLLKEILDYKKINSKYILGSFRQNGKLVLEFPVLSRIGNLHLMVDLDENKQILVNAASADLENLMFPDLDYFNDSFIQLDSSTDLFIRIEPYLSEMETIDEMIFSKEGVQLKSMNRANGYFEELEFSNIPPADFQLTYESELSKNNGWKQASKIYLSKEKNPIYEMDNPLLKEIQKIDIKENRNLAVEFDFPFIKSYVFKIKNATDYEIMNDQFNFREEAFQSKIAFHQSVQKNESEILVSWQFYLGKTNIHPKEIGELLKFLENVKTKSQSTLILKKRN
jgi:hypothetical protein